MLSPGTYSNAVAVTPSDTVNVPATVGLYVGGAGNLTLLMADDPTNTAVVFTAVAAGSLLPIRVKRVKATGTTATLIIALR